MTAKQYMNRVRKIDREIEALLHLSESTRESLESITQNYEADGAQSTKNPHKYDRLVELDDLINQKINEQIALKAEILKTILKLNDRRHRLVLIEYYLNCKTWEQVAVDIHYSWRQTMNLHGNALQEIQKILNAQEKIA